MKVMKRMLGTLLLVTAVWAVATVAWGAETEINETTSNYETLIEGGGEFKLTSDISGTFTLNIAKEKIVTIDLNGHSLKRSSGGRVIVNYGTITIKDTSGDKNGFIGYASSTNSTSKYDCIYNEGTINIQSGGFKQMKCTASNKYVIRNNGSIIMTGGFISNLVSTQKNTIYQGASGKSGSFKMTGGIISSFTTARGYASFNSGYSSIIEVSGTTAQLLVTLDKGTATYTFTGGKFLSDPISFMPAGYNCHLEESKYVISSGDEDVFSIGDDDFGTLAGAIENIADNTSTEITLNYDIVIGGSAFSIGANKNITIDLNGHRIIRPSGSKNRLFTVSGNFILTDSGDTKGYIQNANATTNQGAAVKVNAGASFTLDGAIINGCKTNSYDESGGTKAQNGGAVYVAGGTFIMQNNAIIRNCESAKNSGAVHLTRSEGVGSTFTMNDGCYIENCTATGEGGAVCVGSQCVFNFESGAIIKNCTAGTNCAKAIFVDVANEYTRDETEENVYGILNLKGSIKDSAGSNIADLTDYIKSYGLVYTWDSENSKYVITDDYQQYSAARIIGIAPVLSDSISLRVYYEFAGADADYEKTLALRYKLGNGTEIISTDSSSDTSGTYFIVPGITADMIDKLATVQITFDEYANDTSNTYSRDDLTEPGTMSIKQYCEYVISVAEDTSVSEELRSSKLQNLVKAVLIYGSEARKYNDDEYVKVGSTDEDYKVNSDLYTTLNGVGGFAIPDSCASILSGTKDDNNVFVKAYVKVGSKVQVVIQYKTNGGGSNVFVGDTPISNTTYAGSIYTKVFDELKPTEFDEAYVVKINHSTDKTLTLTYSVNTYCIRMQNDSEVGALVKAMYLYGKAAEAYIAE